MTRTHVLAAIAAVSLISFAQPSLAAVNLIVNGDFEAGNTGFASDYVPNVPTFGQGEYAVDDDPNDVHPAWASFGDHTSGTGNMLIVNGDDNTNARVWYQENIAVTPFTNYLFSGWFASSYPTAPAELVMSINGVDLGPSFVLSSTPGQWQQFSAVWNSGASNVVNITALVNRNGAFTGNDFVADDLSLIAVVPEPSAWALMILGFGAAGAMIRRRQTRLLVA